MSKPRLAGLFAVAAGLIPSLVLVGPAAAAPACGPVSVAVVSRAQLPVGDWAENLGYDAAGALWVSRLHRGRIETVAPAPRDSVAVDDPGAVRLGPDGRLYATTGDTTINLLPGAPRTGTVVRWDPAAPKPKVVTVTRGLGMPNGLTFADGALYVADSALGVLRIRKDGTVDRAWSARTAAALAPLTNGFGVNGIATDGARLYVTQTGSATGRVLSIPLNDPSRARVLDLTAPLPGMHDDLVLLPNGRLAVTSATGQLVTVDPKTGRTCARNVGHPLTSLAADPARPGRLVAGTVTGDLVALRPR